MNEFEINKQIAELLGYTLVLDVRGGSSIHRPDGSECQYTSCPNPDDAWKWAFVSGRGWGEFWGDELIPLWATDTDAALALLDTLPDHLWVRIERGYARAIKALCWYCVIETAEHSALGGGNRHETQALAICKAWIAYKQAEAALKP